MTINDDLIESLLHEEESSILDFKSEQYSFVKISPKLELLKGDDFQKSEVLKDIIAFANARRRTDSYILLGVREVKGGRSEVIGLSEHLDDAQLQEFVNKKVQRPIDFRYIPYEFEGKQIALIWIPIQESPFFLLKDYGKLKANYVYIRRGSSTDIASPDEIKKMGVDSVKAVPKYEPVLNLCFSLPDNTDTNHLKIESVKDIEKEEVLKIFREQIVSKDALELIEKYDHRISSVYDRYPDGKTFFPYGYEKVIEHNKKIEEIISLIENDFEEFTFRKSLFGRAIELADSGMAERRKHFKQYPAYVKIKISNEKGNCPAKNVAVYIRSERKVRFLSDDTAKEKNIWVRDKIPEEIETTIKAAETISSGDSFKIITMFEKQLGRRFNSARDFVANYEIFKPYDFAVKKNEPDVADGKLRIFIEEGIRHKHFCKRNCYKIYLCSSLKKGESEQLSYECHAENLSEPAQGFLTIEGI